MHDDTSLGRLAELVGKDVYVREVHVRLGEGEICLLGDFPDDVSGAPRWVKLVLEGVVEARLEVGPRMGSGLLRLRPETGVLEIHAGSQQVATLVVPHWRNVRCEVARKPFER